MSTIQILRPGDEGSLEDFLRPRLDSSLFLLSNLSQAGIVDRGERFCGTYWASLDGGRIEGVIGHYWQGNLVLQTPAGLRRLLAAIEEAGKRPIRGLLGLADQVGRARELLGWGDDEVQFDDQEGLYALQLDDLVVPEDLLSGRVSGRRIERRDVELAVRWRAAYCLEALEAEDSPILREQCRGDVESSFGRGETWVLERDGEAVASTSFNARTDEMVQVGGVWTPPDLRGHGYGRSAVAVSLLDVREESVERAILFTGDDNVSAVRAYAALGFRRIDDFRIVLRRGSED